MKILIKGGRLIDPASGRDEPGDVATRRLRLMRWGLVPHWVKSASDAKLRAPKLVNAKSDTASTGTAFRDAWLGHVMPHAIERSSG